MSKLLDKILDMVTSAGAEGDLIFSHSKSLRLSAQKGELSTYNVSSAQLLGLRLIKDHRVGLSFTESLDEASLRLLVEQARQNAELSEENPHETILALSGELRDEETYPEAPVDIAEKTRRALELETRMRELDRRVVAVPYNGYTEGESGTTYLSTKGRRTSYADKSYSITTSALLDEHGKKAIFYHGHIAHTFKELDWQGVIDHALNTARDLLTEKPLPNGKYSVRFDKDCLKDLVECFGNFYSAKAAMDKVNPWAQKLGEEVISKDLTLIDDPSLPEAFRATRFDSEGVEAKPLTLVQDGRLSSFLHNSVTASQMNTKTTGHAARTPGGGSLGVSGTHFVIRGKNVKAAPSRWLEVIQMDGLYSGANRVTGNFSVGAKGYVWENGVRTGVFGNVTISGNLIELLRTTDVVGEELIASSDRSFFSVPLMFHQLSVAGS